jgi:hypothetical protein
MRWPTARTRKTEPGSPARSQVANQLATDGPDPPAGLQALGTRGRGSTQPPSARPPGPQLSEGTAQNPQGVHRKQDLVCSRSPPETLGYHQPRDSHVHGAPTYVLSQHDDLSNDPPHLFAGTE